MGMSGISFTKSVEAPAQLIWLWETPATFADLTLGEESAGDSDLMQSTEFSDFQRVELSPCNP